MTTLTFACILALTVAGMMTGIEFTVDAFVHPQLKELDDATHAKAAQALARTLGTVMPFWYAASLLLSGFVAYNLRGQAHDSLVFRLAAAAAVLYLVSIVYTIAALVPINNCIAKWDVLQLPADWKTQRLRWDALHKWRVRLLVVAFICLASACVGPHTLA